jgi:FkbM family methyltransferase
MTQTVSGETSYFSSLRPRLETAPSPVRASVMEHLDYLADKAGKTSQELLSGARFTVHPQYEKDAKAHIEVLLGPFTLEDGDTAYFVALRDRLQAASARTRAGVMIHLDYLADKAGKTSQELLSGARFVTRAQTERDVKHCINEVFQWTSGDAGVASAPHIGQAPGAALDRPIIDQLSWDLDEIEKRSKMLGSYTRIDPEIIEQTHAGINFRFIIYHIESQLWFGQRFSDRSLDPVVKGSLLRPNDVVFDLGCNSGFYTTWFALKALRGHVYAFDPYPWNVAATKANAAINGCANVTAFAVGLGKDNRTIKADMRESKTFNAPEGAEGYEIDLKVDEPTAYLKYNPTFLKIDIEGAEHELADTALLSHQSVQRGYVEMHPGFIQNGGGDPAHFLRRLAATGFDVLDHNLNKIDCFEPVQESQYNFKRGA